MRKERDEAIALRAKGMTYTEIQKQLGVAIPKATLSHWCRSVPLSQKSRRRIEALSRENLKRGRRRALEIHQETRLTREHQFHQQNQHLLRAYMNDADIRKIVLAILHLAEGHKISTTVVFGNSDPDIIAMFIGLLRSTYVVDEHKFRITVQCRADQDTSKLEKFWSKVTDIPLSQFYKPQVDKRTVGKKTQKLNYMGVCRIDYLSSIVNQELKYIARMLKTR